MSTSSNPDAIPAPAASRSLMRGLAVAYEDHGYRAGHSAAAREFVSLLFATADDLLQRPGEPDPEARRLIYLFISHVQARMESAAGPPGHFVEGGLGI